MRPIPLSAALFGALLLVGCAGSALPSSEAVVPPQRESGTALWPVTREIAQACRAAQATARFTVLCPSRLPRPTEGRSPEGLRLMYADRDRLDIGYAAGYEQPGTLHLNGPRRFLHLEIGRARGLAPNARRARLGGLRGHYAPASSARFAGSAPYHSNHASFVWRDSGTRYVATMHTFGDPATRRLLGRIVAALVPAAEVVPASPGRGLTAEAVDLDAGAANIGVGHGSVWVSTIGTAATAFRGRIVQLDEADLSPRSERRIGGFSPSSAVTRDAVWSAPPLTRRDPANGRGPARIPTARGHDHVAIAEGEGALWLATNAYGTTVPRSDVWRIDARRDRVAGRTRLPGRLGGIAVAAGGVWVTDTQADTKVRIEVASGRVTDRVPTGASPGPIAAGHGSVWVSNTADRTVTRIDASGAKVVATIVVGDAPHGIAVDGRGVRVATTGSFEVVRIDARTNRPAQRLPVGGDPVALTSDGRRLIIGMNSDGLVLRVDPLKVIVPGL